MQTIRYEFPGNELTAGPTLRVTWTDGGLRPERKPAKLPPDVELPKTGSLFIGEKGNMVLPHVSRPRFYPVENYQNFVYPEEGKELNHWHRWIDAIVDGTKTTAGFDYTGMLSETVQLGNVATRYCRAPKPKRGTNAQGARDVNVLKWDADQLRFTNSDEANALLTRTYRPGWEVPPA